MSRPETCDHGVNGKVIIECQYAHDIQVKNKKCLDILKMFYRKHYLGDDSMSWDELGQNVCDMLCNLMGNKYFQEWVKELNYNERKEP